MFFQRWHCVKNKILRKIGIILALCVFIYFYIYHFSETSNLKTTPQNQLNEQKKKFDLTQKSLSSLPVPAQYLKVLNVSFVPYLKNPCWFEEGETLQCLPYVFTAGMPKCGTSDMYYRLTQHPDVISPSRKANSWWAWRRFDTNRSFDSYITKFELGDYFQTKCDVKPSSDAENISSSCKRLITVDGSEPTFWCGFDSIQRLKNISNTVDENNSNVYLKEMAASRITPFGNSTIEMDGFTFTLADEIRLILPNARFIVLFREPTIRMFSAYKWFLGVEAKKKDISPSHFHSLVTKYLESWNICRQRFSERYCAYTKEVDRHIGLRINVGLYSVFLKEWLSVFPRDQIMIIRTEDFSNNMEATLKDIFRYLNLMDLDKSTMENIARGTRKNDGSAIQIGEMLPKTEKILRDFYRPFNEELASILNDTKFLWEDVL